MGAEKIVEILMRRDGLSESEAWAWYEDGMAEVMDAIEGGSCLDPEEAFMDEFGLEPDYLMEVLF